MSTERPPYPIIDLHCDMTLYLAIEKGAAIDKTEEIGCALPYLKQGKVRLQVMAFSSVTSVPNTSVTLAQMNWYKKMLSDYGDSFVNVTSSGELDQVLQSEKVGIVPAIENASALCGPHDSLEDGFMLLDKIISECGRPLYISLTHHGENRFGGGNYAEIGLKDDGRAMLEYMSGKKIAIDLSHTNDTLAHDIIDHIDARGLNVPVIASHSNFRSVFQHARNLPDELAKEIIDRKGLIGMNFLRAFMHPTDPDYLRRHIAYGLEIGGAETIAMGADFFYTLSHPDRSRIPFYFPQHEHAGKYQEVLSSLTGLADDATVANIAFGNAARFLQRLEAM